jgi:glycosyltransferase involved in cell wall biosynthesis
VRGLARDLRQDSADHELPLVSVLTPSFNQGRFLSDCLGSVAAQTYPRIEHIVCDGGSTDESIDVLSNSGSRVSWISEPDHGQSHALNKALNLSKGSILGWLNSDDAYFSPTAVEAAVDVFRRRPAVDVVYGHSALVGPDGLVLHLIWAPPYSYRLLRTHTFIIQPAAFIRRSAVGSELVDETFNYSMDRELWLRLGRRARFARVDCVVAIDRHHAERKVYTRHDLAEVEDRRIVSSYGTAGYAAKRGRRKAIAIAQRLVALKLLPATRARLAFPGYVDSPAKLVIRQVFMPRRLMPFSVKP